MPISILVVDDQKEVLNAITEILASEGFRLVIAENGKKALAALDREPPDLVITDICMPDMEGIQLMREMSKRNVRVPIIAMSGNPIGQRFMAAASKLGAVGTLLKPFSSQELVSQIRTALTGQTSNT